MQSVRGQVCEGPWAQLKPPPLTHPAGLAAERGIGAPAGHHVTPGAAYLKERLELVLSAFSSLISPHVLSLGHGQPASQMLELNQAGPCIGAHPHPQRVPLGSLAPGIVWGT